MRQVSQKSGMTQKHATNADIKLVQQLGEKIGYSNLMKTASALWAVNLEKEYGPGFDEMAFVPAWAEDIKKHSIAGYKKALKDKKKEVLQALNSKE